MADDLIFPIGFDLEKAVNEAGQQWDKKYAKKLEDYIGKRPVKVKLDFENLTDVKARLAQLKIEPITPETKAAIKELARELQVLAKALEQVQKYSSRSAGTAEVRGARVDEIEAKASAAKELARQRAAKAEQAELKLAAAREKSATAANKATTAVNNLTKAYGNQTYYIERLLKKMVAVWSVQQVQNFLTNVREVTAQFELQRVSLGAIIQDQNKANQLFSEIKAFALKSPVSILDLTKYTKQLAAYKIGVGELFETTKKLTDVSVGLGVSMDRVVLAYGQTRATGYLRASEIRQFTEMGVPIVEELAAKLSKMNGELVTAADVMDLVSKRGISFELVKEVFDDMTSAGGIFYNMQEKQGNTLFGMWAKLGDAASVMYDEIGNTESVDSGMKTAIGLLTELMRNWKAVAQTAKWVIIPNAALLALYKYSTATQRVEAAQSAAAAATERRKAAVLQLATLNEKATVDEINAAWATLQKAKADEVAAQKATTRMGLLKSGFVSVAKSIGAGLGIGVVIGAVTTLAYKLFEAYENAHRLDRKLDEIDAERITLASQSVRNFEYLADIAVNAADGSKKQKNALDELHRTYKDMIPVQDLTIEHLRQLREGTNSASEAYKSLTTAIREYISEQQKQKKLSAIEEEYGAKIQDSYKSVRQLLLDGVKGFRGEKVKLSDAEIERFFVELEKRAGDVNKSVNQKIREALSAAGVSADAKMVMAIQTYGNAWGNTTSEIEDFINATKEQEERINAVHTGYAGFVGDLGKYGAEMSRIADVMENKIYKANGKVLESNSFLRNQMQSNAWIKEWTNSLKTNLSSAGIEIKNEWFNFIERLNTSAPNTISSINFEAILEALNTDAIREKLGEHYEQTKNYVLAIQKEYQDLVPKDAVVRSVRSKFEELANSMGLIDKVKGDSMGVTEGLEDYRKKINDTAKDYAQQVENLTKVLAATPVVSLAYAEIADKLKDAKDLEEFYSKMAEILGKSTSGGSGRTSDPRLQNLKEEISLTKKLYDEYQKLEKQIGATKAAEKIQEIYSNTIKTLQDRATTYKFDFKLPFTDKNLKANMQHFIDKMKELQGLKDKKGKPLFPNIGKEIDEAVAQLEDVDLNSLQKSLEKKLKQLADRISRTKTAKEFYEKILSQMGDVELAARVSLSIYGSTGEELFEDTVKQIKEVFKSGNKDVKIDLSPVFDMTNQRIDYKMLADIYEKYQDSLIAANKETAKKIAQEGQKEVATNIANWQKELAKAQSFEEQRTAIIKRESEKRAKIIKETRDPQERNRLVSLSYNKQAQDLAKLAVDEFKSSDDYIKVFQDLDRVSTQTLDRMKKRLQEMIATVKDTENVDGLKSLVEQLDKINEERETRNPIEGLVNSFKRYAKARKDFRTAEANEAKVKAEFAEQELGLNMAIQTAKVEQTMAQKRVTDLEAQGLQHTDEYVSAQRALENAKNKVTQATEKHAKAVKKVKGAEQGTTDATDEMKDSMYDMQKSGQAIVAKFNAAASAIQTIADMMGVAEDSELGDIVNGLVSGLQNAATIMSTILTLAIAVQSACWWLLAIGAAVAAFTAIGSWLTGSKVRKANKEIERQQELLDQLEYTYGRLEKAAEKAFGADYVTNFKKQQRNLQAQAEAYRKQAQAERDKGKDADEEKIKEYENAYRDTMDKIADMQGRLAEQMTGTDVASAARDFASAWLEAYASFGNTTDAIKEKFNDMIKNMIVESVMAQTIQMALQPMFDEMDKMYKSGASMTSVLSYAFSQAGELTGQITDALAVSAKQLESMGIDIRDLYASSDNMKGIAKDIAGATSEEINTAAAIGNTIMYHTSHLPIISQNVAAMYELMSQGKSSNISVASTGWTDWQQQAMDNYNAIARNTAETVVECKRAADACTAATEKLNRAFRAKGATSGFNVFLNS